MAPDFHFDKKKHIYTRKGIVIPGVTTVMQFTGLSQKLDGIPLATLKRKAQIGETVDLACEFWEQGTLEERTVDPAVAPYLKSFQKFCELTGWKTVSYQPCMAAELYSLWYGMTADRTGTMDWEFTGNIDYQKGDLYVLDIKTTYDAHPHSWAVQTAAYAWGISNQVPALPTVHLGAKSGDKLQPHRIVSHLQKDGSFNPRKNLYYFASGDDITAYHCGLYIWYHLHPENRS